MESRTRDFTYTTDNDSTLLHKRKIGTGGYSHVHEMYDLQLKQCFARKLLHLPRQDIEAIANEARALRKLCHGQNLHIIKVANLGEFRCYEYYFIDMELCDMSLETYLYPPSPDATLGLGLPPFIKDLPSASVACHILDIMRQIADGLKFIHGHGEAHRDLKPSNVLYSRKDGVWKLTDFGLTSEAAASRLYTTTKARGTPGYRAPEVDLHKKFNNKVDIWSMGCVLHELAVGRPAFGSDLELASYCFMNQPYEAILDERFNDSVATYISGAISRTLAHNPAARPRVVILYDEFCSLTNFRNTGSSQTSQQLDDEHLIDVPLITFEESTFSENSGSSSTAPQLASEEGEDNPSKEPPQTQPDMSPIDSKSIWSASTPFVSPISSRISPTSPFSPNHREMSSVSSPYSPDTPFSLADSPVAPLKPTSPTSPDLGAADRQGFSDFAAQQQSDQQLAMSVAPSKPAPFLNPTQHGTSTPISTNGRRPRLNIDTSDNIQGAQYPAKNDHQHRFEGSTMNANPNGISNDLDLRLSPAHVTNIQPASPLKHFKRIFAFNPERPSIFRNLTLRDRGDRDKSEPAIPGGRVQKFDVMPIH